MFDPNYPIVGVLSDEEVRLNEENRRGLQRCGVETYTSSLGTTSGPSCQFEVWLKSFEKSALLRTVRGDHTGRAGGTGRGGVNGCFFLCLDFSVVHTHSSGIDASKGWRSFVQRDQSQAFICLVCAGFEPSIVADGEGWAFERGTDSVVIDIDEKQLFSGQEQLSADKLIPVFKLTNTARCYVGTLAETSGPAEE